MYFVDFDYGFELLISFDCGLDNNGKKLNNKSIQTMLLHLKITHMLYKLSFLASTLIALFVYAFIVKFFTIVVKTTIK